jgi:hypothetical protein
VVKLNRWTSKGEGGEEREGEVENSERGRARDLDNSGQREGGRVVEGGRGSRVSLRT